MIGTYIQMGTGTQLQPDAIRSHLADVLASPQFAASARLSRFLKYCVEASVDVGSSRIKEHEIAVEVFDRDVDF